MSAIEAVAVPAPVEEAKPTETVAATESSAPAAEVTKTEDAAAPVRLFFVCYISLFLISTRRLRS
jgi:hypothetical protein